MKLKNLLHEEYYCRGRLVIFRCTECGYTSLSLGALHGHAERHRGYTRFNIQLPFGKTAPAKFSKLMNYTDIYRVEHLSEIDLQEVEGL